MIGPLFLSAAFLELKREGAICNYVILYATLYEG